jgi:hypothetical protein
MKAPRMPKSERLVIPAGTFQAILYDIWDIGWQVTEWKGKPKIMPKIILAFEINKRIGEEHPRAGERFAISRRYTFNFGKMSNLGRDIETWLNRKLTDREREDFDIETMISKNCLLGIIQTEKEGNIYSNISSIMPIMEGMIELQIENKRGIPAWVQKLIDESISEEEAQDRRERDAQLKSEERVPEVVEAKDDDENDIPF